MSKENNKLDRLIQFKGLYRLSAYYKELSKLLNTFFDTNPSYIDDKFDEIYEKLWFDIRTIIVLNDLVPKAKDTDEFYRPLPLNLKSQDINNLKTKWEYHGKETCNRSIEIIDRRLERLRIPSYPLEEHQYEFLAQVETLIDEFKKNEQKELIIGKKVHNLEINSNFNFNFVKDQKIEEFLIRDTNEANIAYENGLYKSTMVLCGTVLESLLIDSLYQIEKEANADFKQKYPKQFEKSKKIEDWKMYQLIEIAKRLGIISIDVYKFSHILKDYRNLVHLYVEKKDNLQVDEKMASIMINLLDISYNNISSWYERNFSPLSAENTAANADKNSQM